MGIFILQQGRFADSQESRFQAANRSNTGNAVLQGGRLATAQEYRFQAAKRSDMGSAVLQGGRLATFQNRVSGCESFRYEQCHAA